MTDRRPVVVVDADVLGRHRTGDERYVLNLLRWLPDVAPDLAVRAVTRHPDLVPDGVEAIHLPTTSTVARMLRTLPAPAAGADLLHTQYVVPPRWRGRVVITVHDLSFVHHPRMGSHRDWLFLRTLVPIAARRADGILTVSRFSAEAIGAHYGVDDSRIRVTPNGLDPGFGPAGPTPDVGRPYVLVVGAIQPRKDPSTAVAAFAGLGRDDLDLVMIGPERKGGDEVRALVERLGLRDRVRHLGHVAEDELAAYYRGARALLFPTRYEGFGLPTLEAMASGTPVVASDVAPVREIVGDAGLLCPPGDVAAFTAALARVLADGDGLAERGVERAARFSWRAMAEGTATTYRRVLAGVSGR